MSKTLRNGRALSTRNGSTRNGRVATANAVIKAFGGLMKTTRALRQSGNDVPFTTIDSWRRNGIPRWRWDALHEAAHRCGVHLPKDLTGKH